VPATKKARINDQITAHELRLIDVDGSQVGVVNIEEALRRAREASLDLVEIAPQLTPPVCRIMDFGKYLFEQRKRLKKKSKKVHIKELKMRPVTDIGDYLVKIKQAKGFLVDGNKVKFFIRFRGRELSYQQQGYDILRRAEEDLGECGVAEQLPKMEGKQMTMIMVPGKNKNNIKGDLDNAKAKN
jgi:translation initiation factor IF-3